MMKEVDWMVSCMRMCVGLKHVQQQSIPLNEPKKTKIDCLGSDWICTLILYHFLSRSVSLCRLSSKRYLQSLKFQQSIDNHYLTCQDCLQLSQARLQALFFWLPCMSLDNLTRNKTSNDLLACFLEEIGLFKFHLIGRKSNEIFFYRLDLEKLAGFYLRNL